MPFCEIVCFLASCFGLLWIWRHINKYIFLVCLLILLSLLNLLAFNLAFHYLHAHLEISVDLCLFTDTMGTVVFLSWVYFGMWFLNIFLKLMYSLIQIRKIIKKTLCLNSHTNRVTKAKITTRSRLHSSCSCHCVYLKYLFLKVSS